MCCDEISDCVCVQSKSTVSFRVCTVCMESCGMDTGNETVCIWVEVLAALWGEVGKHTG